ncbi:hypothetical protein NHP21011_12560 [Helicobacter heilmannii]|nr:hypothetical protein NHP21011_12560 [Helicobacter heilmannii]
MSGVLPGKECRHEAINSPCVANGASNAIALTEKEGHSWCPAQGLLYPKFLKSKIKLQTLL